MSDKTSIIAFRINPEDKKTLEEFAAKERLSLSDFCRRQSFSYNKRKVSHLIFADGTKVKIKDPEDGKIKFLCFDS